jgi:hypothetical protein
MYTYIPCGEWNAIQMDFLRGMTMTSRLLKTLVLFAVAALVAGCKLAVIVPSGGDVTSGSGTRNCAGGSLCEFNITEDNFDETFTASPRPGYVFTKWQKGDNFQCSDSTNPNCRISNAGVSVIDGVLGIIAGGKIYYAMPLFDFVGIDTDGDEIKDHVDTDDDNDGVLDGDDSCPLIGPNNNGFGCPGNPITDTVNANGKEWAQPDLFDGLTWNQIVVACPGGICTADAVLNGFEMNGWVWASVDELNSMLSSLASWCDLGSGPSECREPWTQLRTCQEMDLFFYEFRWSTFYCTGNWVESWAQTKGLTQTLADGDQAYLAGRDYVLYEGGGWNIIATNWLVNRDVNGDGAWFYRSAP